MPDDTDDNPVSKAQNKAQEINKRLQDFTRHIQAKAARRDDNVIASFQAIEQACRLLCFKIAIAQRSGNIEKNALANFLDVLSHAESFRLKILEQADLALNTWNVYYSTEDPSQALSPKEAKKLGTILKAKDEWRTVYMKILRKTIASDLYYLFISKPWFASDFMVRLLEYNPDMFKPTDGHEPSPRNLIRLLSDDEIKAVKDTTQRSLQSVKDSYEWLEENYPDNILEGLYSEEFLQTHHPPNDLHRLESLLHYYLKHISEDYKTFIAIFPAQTNSKS